METPDSPYASSPESAPKRFARPRSPASDDMEKPTHIRFLVSNTAAGSIIGKGGSTITEFQAQSGARIQVSRNHEVYPGTSDRIIMISGAVGDIIKGTEMILEKLISKMEESNEVDMRSKTRLIVPNSSCGAIIGKGASTIKSFVEESQAGIKISPQDHNFVGLNDRLVTLTGSIDEQMRAIMLIMSKLAEDSYYPHTLNSPFPYAGVGFPDAPVGYMIPPVAYNTMGYGMNGAGGKYPINKASVSQVAHPRSPAGPNDGQGISVTIGVADEHIGAVVGRGGRNIMEISQVSGARIKISNREDFMPGTSDREKKRSEEWTMEEEMRRETMETYLLDDDVVGWSSSSKVERERDDVAVGWSLPSKVEREKDDAAVGCRRWRWK